jgi:hypothetical protein
MAGYWRDHNKDNLERLYHCIWYKASKYSTLVGMPGVAYVVGVFPEFTALVDSEEVRLCLVDEETGLFHKYPELSGVLYFEQSSGQYVFSYLRNPNASQALELPTGVFSAQ